MENDNNKKMQKELLQKDKAYLMLIWHILKV